MATFNTRLLELRKQRGLTQSELADALEVNKQTISQYERGVRRPDFDTLCTLCDYFNVSTDYMLGKADRTLRYVDHEGLARLDGTNITRTLTPDQSDLLNDYDKLNDLGKKKARDDVSDLTEIPRYCLGEPDYLQPVAAHDREDILVSEDMVDADNVLMKKLEEKRKQQDKK